MLVDREPQETLVRVNALSKSETALPSHSAALSAAIFLLFLALVIVLQLTSGAYRAEFGGYPDEPAHYVTSLMVRDYLVGFDWRSPVQFAQHYYHYYPKVALGHWPPFFYLVQACWMLLFSASRSSVRLEVAFTTAVLAYSVYLQARRWFEGYSTAIVAGLLTVCLPLVQVYADEEMSETLLTLLCFWAAVNFAKYLDSERWRDNLLFGVCFSLAVLTKGNGWLLAAIVPIALLLTRKLRIALRWHFWIAPVLVLVICLPWQLLTLSLAEQGWAGGTKPSLTYTAQALGEFGLILLNMAGSALGLLACWGIVVTVLAPAVRRRIGTRPATMFGLIVATWVFHAVVPAGIEDRKMLIAVPALILFLFAGGFWLADRIPVRYPLASWRRQIVLVAAAALFGMEAFAIPHEQHYGYTEVARFICSQPELQHDTILVSDDSVGEGLLISELAMYEKRPTHVIVRGTKALADVDWNASRYHSLFSSPEQVTGALRALHVNLVVIDTFPGSRSFEHNQLLTQAVRNAGNFQLIRTFDGESPKGKGTILMYEVKY